MAARLCLSLVLTQLHLLGWRQPWRLLQLRQASQRQSVQCVPADRVKTCLNMATVEAPDSEGQKCQLTGN